MHDIPQLELFCQAIDAPGLENRPLELLLQVVCFVLVEVYLLYKIVNQIVVVEKGSVSFDQVGKGILRSFRKSDDIRM